MDVPCAILLSLPEYFEVLEALCANMQVESVVVSGYPGYGFFLEAECQTVVDYMVNNGHIFRLLRCSQPIAETPEPPPVPENTPEKSEPRGEPDGAD